MDIVHLRLANGDELFANRISEEGSTILLDNVMYMETIHVESDVKYLFMSRYTQYCDKHSITIDRSQIVFLNEASETVQRHYITSVLYAESISDDRFLSGISDATDYLLRIMRKGHRTEDTKFDPDSSTKH